MCDMRNPSSAMVGLHDTVTTPARMSEWEEGYRSA